MQLDELKPLNEPFGQGSTGLVALQRTTTASSLLYPVHESPKTSLLAFTLQVVRPTHAAVTAATGSPALLHAGSATRAGQVPEGTRPYDAKSIAKIVKSVAKIARPAVAHDTSNEEYSGALLHCGSKTTVPAGQTEAVAQGEQMPVEGDNEKPGRHGEGQKVPAGQYTHVPAVSR